jgi:hypothetical protein
MQNELLINNIDHSIFDLNWAKAWCVSDRNERLKVLGLQGGEL